MTTRKIKQQFSGKATSDGAGVKLTRIFDPRSASLLDPFLLFDEFRTDQAGDYIAGFPPHPHRGFETVTYMFAGRMKHQDHMGNEGLLRARGAQWMTAAKGIVHSEMPEQEEGLMHGYQLWLNLPAAEKMAPAEYRDIEPDEIPSYKLGTGVELRVIAGTANVSSDRRYTGLIQKTGTDVSYIHVKLPAGQSISLDVVPGYTAIGIVVKGEVATQADQGERNIVARDAVLFDDGDSVSFLNNTNAEAEVLLLTGKPLKEPVAHYGPFVMNTREEINQAVKDYADGVLTD